METFDDKKIPLLPDYDELDKNSTQDELCEIALCEEEDFDCGDCLFAKMFCTQQLFDKWKYQKLEELKDE